MNPLLKHQRLVLILSLLLLALILAVPTSLRFSTNPLTVLMNLILLLPLFGLFLMLTRRAPVAFLLTLIPFFVISYIDGVVYKSRLIHLRYIDFLTAGDGLRVANRYSLAPNFHTLLLLIFIAFAVFALFSLSKTLKTKHEVVESKKLNFLVGLVLFLCSSGLVASGIKFGWLSGPYHTINFIFDVNGTTERAGLLYALYNEYLNSHITPPDGYSEEAVMEILAKYTDPESSKTDPKPASTDSGASTSNPSTANPSDKTESPLDIIVIMNESLTDYTLVGTPNFSTDPLKNLHDKANNYFEGKLVVPVFGGGTCNTEFEFLTGNSMYLLPSETAPFSQYISQPISSLASDLRENNFKTFGVHPYYSEEWNRKTVYPNLGFETSLFGDDFSSGVEHNTNIFSNTTSVTSASDRISFGSNLEYIRGFISDRECYRKILSLLGSSDNDHNFVFAVTIQNHGGYDYKEDDFTTSTYLEGNDLANQYLTLSSLSDEAFHNFINELKSRDKKTLVLMFGDHQPALETADLVSDFDVSAYGYYTTPYFVWSNFKLKTQFPEITSTNYLSALLKQSAGLPLTAWDNFRLAVSENYPIMSTYFALDSSNNLSKRPSTPALLSDYSLLEYHRLFVEPK